MCPLPPLLVPRSACTLTHAAETTRLHRDLLNSFYSGLNHSHIKVETRRHCTRGTFKRGCQVVILKYFAIFTPRTPRFSSAIKKLKSERHGERETLKTPLSRGSKYVVKVRIDSDQDLSPRFRSNWIEPVPETKTSSVTWPDPSQTRPSFAHFCNCHPIATSTAAAISHM